MIHNFIWKLHTINRLFEEYSIQNMIVDRDQCFAFQENINVNIIQRAQMVAVRDNIVNQIWKIIELVKYSLI